MSTGATPLRTESDYLGSVDIEADSLIGVHTARGRANLAVSSRTIASEPAFCRALAQCKWAAALANRDVGVLEARPCEAIVQACREVAEGRHDAFLVVDLMEGSGGTSTNMNLNEVIANRAQQLMGGALGTYDMVHPNDHVNRSQSTNDVYPSAMKIAAYALMGPLVEEVGRLAGSLAGKSREFGGILHLGRTCLQDAQPMTLGQPFDGYGALAARLAAELDQVRAQLTVLPLGGTAIGTGFGAPAGYKSRVFEHLGAITGVDFVAAQNPFDAMQNLDAFCRVSGELRTCATSLAKVASDLMLLASGPEGGVAELELPAVQAGSSIMPGKINPVIPMTMIQVSFAVLGNDVTVAQANQAGQLEINHFEPVAASRVFDSIRLLTNAVRLFRERCVEGVRACVASNEQHLMQSSAIATALVPRLGYARVSAIVRQAEAEGRPLLDVLEAQGILDREAARAVAEEATRVVR